MDVDFIRLPTWYHIWMETNHCQIFCFHSYSSRVDPKLRNRSSDQITMYSLDVNETLLYTGSELCSFLVHYIFGSLILCKDTFFLLLRLFRFGFP